MLQICQNIRTAGVSGIMECLRLTDSRILGLLPVNIKLSIELSIHFALMSYKCCHLSLKSVRLCITTYRTYSIRQILTASLAIQGVVGRALDTIFVQTLHAAVSNNLVVSLMHLRLWNVRVVSVSRHFTAYFFTKLVVWSYTSRAPDICIFLCAEVTLIRMRMFLFARNFRIIC